MAEIPLPHDPTMLAIAQKIEAKPGRLSGALGMGALGSKCDRQIWYGFRWYAKPRISFKTQLIFDSGFRSEAAMAKLLAEVCEIYTIDPATNYQYGFTDHDGHFKGFMDGVVRGLVQAPSKWHVWDNKEVNQKKFDEFKAIKVAGEKQTIENWNFGYYIQAQLYMDYAGIDRHYMTVTTSGMRDIETARTEHNADFAKAQIQRARRIIYSSIPPQRISQKKDHFECRWCDFKDKCHGDARILKTCRSCIYSQPAKDGLWFCKLHKRDMDKKQQETGCESWTEIQNK